MMDRMKTLGMFLLLALVTAFALVAFGLWIRVAKELFCIGYGC